MKKYSVAVDIEVHEEIVEAENEDEARKKVMEMYEHGLPIEILRELQVVGIGEYIEEVDN